MNFWSDYDIHKCLRRQQVRLSKVALSLTVARECNYSDRAIRVMEKTADDLMNQLKMYLTKPIRKPLTVKQIDKAIKAVRGNK